MFVVILIAYFLTVWFHMSVIHRMDRDNRRSISPIDYFFGFVPFLNLLHLIAIFLVWET